MMEPDYGNYCYYDKDGYEWHCLGKCTFDDFVVVNDVENNCLSFYFGICCFVYHYYTPIITFRDLQHEWLFNKLDISQLQRIIRDSRQQLASQIKGGLQPFIGSACRGSPPATNGAQTTQTLVGDILFH